METEGEYSGYWWLPDNPTNRVPGKLIINHNEAKLEIVGHLVDSDELYDVTSFLIVLIEVYLFKTLGFSADNIKKCIGRDYRYQMLMERRGEANGSKES